VILLASSREGEEEAFLEQILSFPSVNGSSDAIKNGVISAPEAEGLAVQWLIVPRHPQRFDEVARCIEARGLTVSRRSTWGDKPPPAPDSGAVQIWLGDSLGEMAVYYALADVALLGGSFEPLGGQNLIEAAACGCPVVMGPHTFNFAQAAELAQAGGAAVAVSDMAEAVQRARQWVNDPGAADAAGGGRGGLCRGAPGSGQSHGPGGHCPEEFQRLGPHGVRALRARKSRAGPGGYCRGAQAWPPIWPAGY
jgi:3-deoxy-D-manno-octulosonic-acid transferase